MTDKIAIMGPGAVEVFVGAFFGTSRRRYYIYRYVARTC
ncbi:MAG: hypothetical protein CM1200mP35_08420 [Chloroflexota bacterium]|nr:MAG: hypothetical protein CM1200mP35_08420 [Chloroflexota bacterium]